MTKDFQTMNIPKLPVFTTEEGINQIGSSGILISYYGINQDYCVDIGYRTKSTLQKYCSFIEKNNEFGMSLDKLVQKYFAEKS